MLMLMSHDSNLIRFVTNYTAVHARIKSFLGHNVLFCAHRYNVSVIGLVRLII